MYEIWKANLVWLWACGLVLWGTAQYVEPAAARAIVYFCSGVMLGTPLTPFVNEILRRK